MEGLDVNAYYALGGPICLLPVGLELWLARRRGERVYGFADTIGNLSAGLGEILVGLFLGPYLLAIYDLGYRHLALIHWPEGSPVPWVLAVVLGDLCYYWYHRAGHAVASFWAIHGVHHQSEEFNVTTAIRHPWFSDTYSWPFYIPLPLLGVTSTQFFVGITLISFYALSIHSKILHRPGFYLFTTPASHIVHHARNPRYIGKNLGAVFTLWDRMFGTHVELDPADPPQLGAKIGYLTHDGALAQWVFFRDMIAAARQAPGLGNKLRIFLGRPGWLPDGMRWPARPKARLDEEIPSGLRTYVALQFPLVLGFSLYILWWRSQHPLWLRLSSSLLAFWALSSLGGLLDGRARSLPREGVRLAGWMLLGLVMASDANYRVAGLVLVTAVALSLAAMRRLTVNPDDQRAEA